MAYPQGLLISIPSGWRIVRLENGNVESETVELALESASQKPLLDQLSKQWPRGAELTVAIRAESVLTIPLEEEGAVRLTQQQLLYDVEGAIPWSAEEAVACPVDRIAVVLRYRPWLNLFNELKLGNFQVQQVIPSAWLWEHSLRKELQLNSSISLLFENEEGVHYFGRDPQGLMSWKFWPVDRNQELAEAHQLVAAEIVASSPAVNQVVAVNISDSLIPALNALRINVDFRSSECTSTIHDWNGMEVSRRHTPMLNLAIGPLASSAPLKEFVRSCKICCWSFICFCLVSMSIMLHRAREFRQATKDWEREQIATFRETFPGAPVPQVIFARFISEHRKVLGQRGADHHEEFPTDALKVLKLILEARSLPMRSRFEEIVVRNGQTEIECEFRNHEEAARMVGALEKAGIEISPPQIQKIDEQRIGTRLRGQLRKTAPK